MESSAADTLQRGLEGFCPRGQQRQTSSAVSHVGHYIYPRGETLRRLIQSLDPGFTTGVITGFVKPQFVKPMEHIRYYIFDPFWVNLLLI